MSDMKDLIAKLEAAAEGSKELDSQIERAIHVDGTPFPLSTPAYTRTIDDALTLVPERWADDICIRRHGGHHWSVELYIPSSEIQGRSKSLAPALCIAALRART